MGPMRPLEPVWCRDYPCVLCGARARSTQALLKASTHWPRGWGAFGDTVTAYMIASRWLVGQVQKPAAANQDGQMQDWRTSPQGSWSPAIWGQGPRGSSSGTQEHSGAILTMVACTGDPWKGEAH